jgi:hypothetical protein
LVSAGNTTWTGGGSLSVGTAEPGKRGLSARIAGSDGASWDQFNNFVQLLSGITGPKLRACWHAAHGLELKYFGGSIFVDRWIDTVSGIALTASNLLEYRADSSNYRGQPVLNISSAANQSLLGTGISGLIEIGEVPEIYCVGRFKSHFNGSTLFSANAAPYYIISENATNLLGYQSGVGVVGPAVLATQSTFILRSDGATTSSLLVNGAASTTGSGAAASAAVTALGLGVRVDGSNTADASIGCFIVFSEQLTTSERAAVGRLLTRDFG